MSGCRSIVKTLVLLFHNTSLLLSSAFRICLFRCFIATTTISRLCLGSIHNNGKFIHYCIPVICAGRSIYPFSCSFHYLVFKFVCSDRIFFSLNMAPKRKATDAGSSLSPLKKRNAVTAGIGRAAESESNGIGFGYYGRTDDREDVSKTVPVFPWFFMPFSQLQCTSYG